MNQTEPDDHDLAEAFQELKAAEMESAPAFSVRSSRRDSWRVGYGIYALAVVSAVIVLAIGLSRDPGARPDAIAFDRFPEIISREVYASTATTWSSPTSFLIDTELLTLTEFDL
jgi:hypothetical protein